MKRLVRGICLGVMVFVTAVNVFADVLDKEAYDKIRKKNEYTYPEPIDEPLYDQVEPTDLPEISSGDADLSWIKWVALALAVVGIGFILFQILKNAGYIKNRDIEELKYKLLADEIPDDIVAAEIKTPLQRAIDEQNWTLAIRLYFLLTLKTLTEKDLIRWNKSKTNKVYARELRSTDFHSDLVFLLRSYEIVWFGKREIGPEQFKQLEYRFEKFISKVES